MCKARRWFVLVLIPFLPALPDAALAVPTVSLGRIELDANTAAQVVEINVTGGDQISGVDLRLQVTNGGPGLEPLGILLPGMGILGPSIASVDLVTGTIFADNHTTQTTIPDATNADQVAQFRIRTSSGTVAANGLLARVTFDTTNLFFGSYSINLAAINAPTEFVDVAADLVNGLLVIGTSTTGGVGPTAGAGANQSVQAGSTVQLSGGGYDPEGADLTFSWRQVNGPAVSLINAATATPSFVVPSGLINTEIAFQLTVSDGTSTDTDEVSIEVNAETGSLTANAGADQTVAAGATVQLLGTWTPLGLTPVVGWLQIDGPEISLVGNGADPTFTAPSNVTNTILRLQFSASSGSTESIDSINVLVGRNDTAPSAYAGPDQLVSAGSTVQLLGSATDPSNEGVNLAWNQLDGPTVTLSSSSVAQPTFTSPAVTADTTLVFELRASAGANTSVDIATITVTPATTTFTVNAGADQTVTAGDLVQLSGSTTGTGVAFQWTQTSGTSVALSDSSAANPTFTAPSVTTATTLQFQLQGTLGTETATDSVAVIVEPTSSDNQSGTNNTPVPLSSILNQPAAALAIGLILFLAILLLWILWI